MKKEKFYPFGDSCVCLPNNHMKSYIDGYCNEYSMTDEDTKFMHLTYATNNGYNLLSEVHKYLDDNPGISEHSLKFTFCQFIFSLRYGSVDCRGNDIVLEDNLTLDDSISLFLIELKLRFSYTEKGDEIIFTQTYNHWPSSESLLAGHDSDYVKQMMLHPTGYRPITEEAIVTENHWPELADSYMKSCWYDESMQLVYPDEQERQIIEQFNAKVAQQYKYVLGAPAEPWRGNPLKAKVIILSLNPGFVKGVNDKVRQNIKASLYEGAMSELCRTMDLKSEGLLYRQDHYVKSHEEWAKNYSEAIDYGDVLNEIGDYYWLRNINRLNTNDTNEFDFFRNFAIIQYCAYTSVSFSDFPKDTILPSQMLTKDLIRHIVYNRKDVQFIIMRSWKRWRNLLDPDVWQMMQPRIVINKNMSQSLSENNLGTDLFNKLTNLLK